MTHQSQQWAVTAINIAEAPSTKQEIEEAKQLRRHWMKTYPQRKLQLFSDISGVAIEDLVREAVDEWIEAHANEYIAKHKAEQIALHEQALTELRNS